MKRVIRISIVVFWLVMVGLLVQRTVRSPPTTPSVQAKLLSHPVEPILQPQEKRMGIYHHDRKIGYLHRELIPTASGYLWTEQWRMKLQVLGRPQMIQTDVQANTDQHYALNDFSFRLRSAGTEFHVAGHVSLTLGSQPEESRTTAPSASRSTGHADSRARADPIFFRTVRAALFASFNPDGSAKCKTPARRCT